MFYSIYKSSTLPSTLRAMLHSISMYKYLLHTPHSLYHYAPFAPIPTTYTYIIWLRWWHESPGALCHPMPKACCSLAFCVCVNFWTKNRINYPYLFINTQIEDYQIIPYVIEISKAAYSQHNERIDSTEWRVPSPRPAGVSGLVDAVDACRTHKFLQTFPHGPDTSRLWHLNGHQHIARHSRSLLINN